MDVREQLIKLIENGLPCPDGRDPFGDYCDTCQYSERRDCANERLADYLIAHGVMLREWHSAKDYPQEEGTYIVQTSTGAITTARFYTFKSFPATRYTPALHRSASWQSNRNVIKWTFLPQPTKGE